MKGFALTRIFELFEKKKRRASVTSIENPGDSIVIDPCKSELLVDKQINLSPHLITVHHSFVLL